MFTLTLQLLACKGDGAAPKLGNYAVYASNVLSTPRYMAGSDRQYHGHSHKTD